jgi:DNA-binding IclR family transcriptional regulator
LRVVAATRTPLGVSELSRQLGLNKSTTHDILTTLCHHRLLERDEPTKTYRLGYGLAELGHRVDERLDLRRVAHPRIVRLSEQVDETVFLGTYRDGYVTIVDKEEASHDVKITSPVGQRMHYSAAAFGKLFLAAMDDDQVNHLLAEKPLRPSTPKSIVKPHAYHATLRHVREQGYAIDDEEYLPGVRAVSAPVNDAHGHVVAALCVVGFGTRLTHDKLSDIARETRRTAESISRELGANKYPEWNGVA